MKSWKRLSVFIVPLIFLLSSAFYFYDDILPYVGKKIYTPSKIATENMASSPILELIQAVRSNELHRIAGLFSDAEAHNTFNRFYGVQVNQGSEEGNYFVNTLFSLSIKSVEQISRGDYPDYRFTIEQVNESQTDHATWKITTKFSPYARQYLISDVSIDGQITNSTPGSQIPIPPVMASPCEPSGNVRFKYIELDRRSAETDAIQATYRPPVDLANLATVSYQSFFKTQAFRQVPFKKLVDDSSVPEPGYVLSIADLRAVDMKDGNGNLVDMFYNIDDASGTFFLTGQSGQLISFPTVALMDNTWRRVILTSSNDPGFNALGGFRNPKAVFLLGGFLYVMDANEIAVFRLFVALGHLAAGLVTKQDFGLDITGASDLSGFIQDGKYFLYIAHPADKSTYQFSIDPATGLPKGSPKRLTTFIDSDGTTRALPSFSRFECSARSATQHFMVGINPVGNIAYAFRVEDMNDDPKIYLNEATYFPIEFGSALTNVGYNVGEQAYYLSDAYASKIHVLSNEGFYLGSGGQNGEGETDNQFLQPNAISSNALANDANEILVANKWSMTTGIKRIRPLAGVADLRVVEKAPMFPDDALLNELDFQFSLTAGSNIDKVTISLNGTSISELTKDNTVFLPKRYDSPFLTKPGPDGIGGVIVPGWNRYEVTVQSTLPGSPLSYTDTKAIEFYYLPSLINQTFVVDNIAGADVVHSSDTPWRVYKSILVEGDQSITFTIQNGKVLLQEGAVIKFAGNVVLNITNEQFDMACGSRLQLVMAEDYPKTLADSKFDGLGQNYNMIAAEGDYTGGLGWGSAPSSMLKFIGCDFANYLGKSIHIVKGRAAIVNCSFVSTLRDNAVSDPDKTAVGVFADPGTRVDVRGGVFKGNDIALDINNADLVLGHPAKAFDDVPVGHPQLVDNVIGVFLNQGTAKIKDTEMVQNKTAVFNLDGSLEIDQNSNVTFQENMYALILSGSATAWKGINLFIDNKTDLYFLVHNGDSKTFDFQCNYWSNSSGEGQPSIAYNPDVPGGDKMLQVVTLPVAEKKGQNYICKGGSSKSANGRVMLTSQQAMSADFPFLGKYSLERNIADVLQQALAKNKVLNDFLVDQHTPTLATRLISADEVKANKRRNHHILVTQDRLALLDMILHRDKLSARLAQAASENTESIDVYPNPIIDLVTIGFNFPKEGRYTIEMLNMYGSEEQVLARKENIQEGYQTFQYYLNVPQGIYLLRIKNEEGDVTVVKRLMKI